MGLGPAAALAAATGLAGLRLGLARGTPLCADLVVDYDVYGSPAKGIDVGGYAHGTLKWIGCAGAPATCSNDTFFCQDLPTGIRFGTTAPRDDDHAMRAQLGDVVPAEFTDCEPWQHSGMVNAPKRQSDAAALCRQMGFMHGTLEDTAETNWCPEARWSTEQKSWGAGSVTPGFGRVFRCDSVCADGTNKTGKAPRPKAEDRANMTGKADAARGASRSAADGFPADRTPGGGRVPGATLAAKWVTWVPRGQPAVHSTRLLPWGAVVALAGLALGGGAARWGRRCQMATQEHASLVDLEGPFEVRPGLCAE